MIKNKANFKELYNSPKWKPLEYVLVGTLVGVIIGLKIADECVSLVTEVFEAEEIVYDNPTE